MEINEYLLGFAVIVLLIMVTGLTYKLVKKYHDGGMSIPYSMVLIDFIIVIAWVFMFKTYADDVKLFGMGIGTAIFVSMIHKVKKFM